MSDWWTQPSSASRGSPFTPTRQSSSSRTRFVNDDPDPNAADAPKFLPAFAASPAGKHIMGTSPVAAQSPPAPKRSPTARFSTSLAESVSSPRNSLARSRPAAPHVDEDIIPTSSLHDDTAPMRTTSSGGGGASSSATDASASVLALPPSLEPNADTTTLHVFGPPAEYLGALRPYLENIGPVVSYTPGPDGSNWWTVQYANPLAASYALRRHGEIVSGRWMLGFKVAGPGSTQGLTLVNGAPVDAVVAGSAPPPPGTAVQVRNVNIMKSKPKPTVAKDEYAWEEQEANNGLLGRAAEFIFGR